MRGRIGCDLDGVVADIVAQLVSFAQLKYNMRLEPKQIVSERAETCTSLSLGQLEEMFRERDFFLSMAVFDGARAALVKLRSMGFAVDIVTDRFWYPEIQSDTRAWLETKEIPFDELIFSRKSEKHIIAEKSGHTLFIEDQVSNALLLSAVTEVYLLDRPYNRAVCAEGRIHRVRELSEVVGLVAGLEYTDVVSTSPR